MKRDLMIKTLTKSGFVVSTVDLMGIDHDGCFYETAIWSDATEVEVVARYKTENEAWYSHWMRVSKLGGRSFWDWFLK